MRSRNRLLKQYIAQIFSEIYQKFFGRTDGNFSDGRRTDERKFFERTDGRTKIFHPSGWAEIFRTAGRPSLRPAGRPNGRTDEKKKRKIQSVSQTIDLVVTIRNLAESSKSELSSRGKRPFKVYDYSANFSAIYSEQPLHNAGSFLCRRQALF